MAEDESFPPELAEEIARVVEESDREWEKKAVVILFLWERLGKDLLAGQVEEEKKRFEEIVNSLGKDEINKEKLRQLGEKAEEKTKERKGLKPEENHFFGYFGFLRSLSYALLESNLTVMVGEVTGGIYAQESKIGDEDGGEYLKRYRQSLKDDPSGRTLAKQFLKDWRENQEEVIKGERGEVGAKEFWQGAEEAKEEFVRLVTFLLEEEK